MLVPEERAELRNFLESRFSLDELQALIFDLGLNPHALPGATIGQLSRAIIEHFENRDQMKRLLAEVVRQRPDPGLARLYERLSPANPETRQNSGPVASPEQKLLAGPAGVRQSLGLDRPEREIGAEIEADLTRRPPALFERGGLCAGRPLTPMPGRYFVAQEFGPDREDLLAALAGALGGLSMTPYRADQDIEPGHILCKVAGKIQATAFGVYELTKAQNRNVYLELGIAIGLGRPFVLIKEAGAAPTPLVEGLNYYNVRSYRGMQRELGSLLGQYLMDIGRYSPAELPPAGSSPTYVIAHGDYHMPPDFCLDVAEAFGDTRGSPAFLGDDNREVFQAFEAENRPYRSISETGGTRLDAVVRAIQASQFGIYRVEADCSADTFLALGIAIGLNRPWRLVHLQGATVPADLRGLSALKYSTRADLARLSRR